jgi:hypothetical protein
VYSIIFAILAFILFKGNFLFGFLGLIIGGSIDYETKTDFTTVGVSFSAFGTQSVRMVLTGQTSEVIDWDIYVNYTKGYHTLTTGGGGGGVPSPWYPVPPSA